MLDKFVYFFTSWLSPNGANVSDETYNLLFSFEGFVLAIFGIAIVGSIIHFVSKIWDSIPFV